MKALRKAAVLSASILMMGTVAVAGGGKAATVKELTQAKQRLAARANNEKGYPRAQLDSERARIGNLIDDLEAGKSVDPSEIDKALERADHLPR